MRGIKRLPRQEKSPFKPSDLWSTTMATATTIDDPINRMIWSLVPDNKTRYSKRFKMVPDLPGAYQTRR
jgi:hypothetical protein